MTPLQFDRFLLAAIGICVLGALMNLVMIKRRGTSAILLASAFLALGGTMELYRTLQSKVVTGLGSLIVAGFLVADLVIRQSGPRAKG